MKQSNENTIVYVIDDDEEVAKSLKWLLMSVNYQVEICLTPEEFLNVYKKTTKCCLILDVRMPFMSGLQLQEVLIKRGISIPIIFMSGHADVSMAVKAMKCGAVDFLIKPINDNQLLEIVHKTISKLDATLEIENDKKQYLSLVDSLTPREREVMELMVQGNLSKQIAYNLGISANTVEIHRAKVVKKMHVKSLAQLVSLATKFRTGEKV